MKSLFNGYFCTIQGETRLLTLQIKYEKFLSMSDGHGGNPKYGMPFLLLVFLSLLVWIYSKNHQVWLLMVIYLNGLVFSWRMCWHLYMYDVMDYDGAYTSKYEMEKAKRRYKKGFFILTPLIFVVLWCFVQNYLNQHR